MFSYEFQFFMTSCENQELKYRIETSKLLICLLFILVNFGFILRKIKVVVVVVDENSVKSPPPPPPRGIHDFRFNPAIKYTLQTRPVAGGGAGGLEPPQNFWKLKSNVYN